jgi:hypothetical protein
VRYQQVTLRLVLGENNHVTDTAFIPQRFASVGNILKVKYGNCWSDGWEVAEVHSTVFEEDEMPWPPAQVRAHKKATGDSDPKQKL